MSQEDQRYLQGCREGRAEPLPDEEVVYGVQSFYDLAVFAPRSEAEHFARLCEAFNRCSTWGDIRAMLPPEEAAELEDQSLFGDGGPPSPSNEDPFDPARVMGWEDSTWPVFPAANMLDWFPLDVAIQYGTILRNYADVWLQIEPQDADVVAARLSALGVSCVRDDALTETMVFR